MRPRLSPVGGSVDAVELHDVAAQLHLAHPHCTEDNSGCDTNVEAGCTDPDAGCWVTVQPTGDAV